jgi:hypothetical protein
MQDFAELIHAKLTQRFWNMCSIINSATVALHRCSESAKRRIFLPSALHPAAPLNCFCQVLWHGFNLHGTTVAIVLHRGAQNLRQPAQVDGYIDSTSDRATASAW